MRLSAALVVLALASAPAAAEVAVRVSGGHVDLTATAAPLADVLDRLARQTGMKVVYEGAAPRQLVTLSLHGRTPTETVLAVFEGLGVNFALVADPSGSRVQTLVVAGTARLVRPRLPRPPAVRRPRRPRAGRSARRPERARRPSTPPSRRRTRSPRATRRPSPGCPPGAEVADPSGVPMAPPDPTLANPAAQGPSAAAAGHRDLPACPRRASPSSPFMPQPQPFPPPPAGVPRRRRPAPRHRKRTPRPPTRRRRRRTGATAGSSRRSRAVARSGRPRRAAAPPARRAGPPPAADRAGTPTRCSASAR